MTEIKKEDIGFQQAFGNVELIIKYKSGKNAEELKQQILQDHEDAKKYQKLKDLTGSQILDKWIDYQNIVKRLEELDFGVLLQSLRDDFSEDKNHVPNDVLKKMIKNTETMMNIQKILEGKK